MKCYNKHIETKLIYLQIKKEYNKNKKREKEKMKNSKIRGEAQFKKKW